MERATIYSASYKGGETAPVVFTLNRDDDCDREDMFFEESAILLPDGFHASEDYTGWWTICKDNCPMTYRVVGETNDGTVPADKIRVYLVGGSPFEVVPVKRVRPWYFTFGYNDGIHTDYPYEHAYLVVYAENEVTAVKKFRDRYPNDDNDFIRCAFWYPEKKFKTSVEPYYPDGPAEIIQ